MSVDQRSLQAANKAPAHLEARDRMESGRRTEASVRHLRRKFSLNFGRDPLIVKPPANANRPALRDPRLQPVRTAPRLRRHRNSAGGPLSHSVPAWR